MPRAPVNGIEIEYESLGDPSGEPLLLVMGLGGQLVLWPDSFCNALVERGYHVIRYDNRDVGLSSKFADVEHDPPLEAMRKASAGEPVRAPYLMHDIAADGAGLLDALELERAHVVGASMGGMIAQTLAIAFPDRVQTLTSIMSTTGDRSLPGPKPEAMQILMRPTAQSVEEAIEGALTATRIIGSPGHLDEDWVRESTTRSWERDPRRDGLARQLVAIMASGSRRSALETLNTPTLVIHGEDDPLVPVECGRDTLSAIPGAKGLFITGMGHDLPTVFHETVIDAIHDLASDHPIH